MTIQLNNPKVTFTSTASSAAPTMDYTGYIASMTINGQKSVISRNTFGTTGQQRNKKGRFDGTVTIDIDHDYAGSAKPSQYFFARLLEDAPVTIEAQSEQGNPGASNPVYTFDVAIDNWNPIDGGADDLATTSVTWPIHGEITETYS